MCVIFEDRFIRLVKKISASYSEAFSMNRVSCLVGAAVAFLLHCHLGITATFILLPTTSLLLAALSFLFEIYISHRQWYIHRNSIFQEGPRCDTFNDSDRWIVNLLCNKYALFNLVPQRIFGGFVNLSNNVYIFSGIKYYTIYSFKVLGNRKSVFLSQTCISQQCTWNQVCEMSRCLSQQNKMI